MKKIAVAILGIFVFFSIQGNAQTDRSARLATPAKTKAPMSIYQFKVKDIDGKEFDFAQLRGKKVLIVNTASKCGYTPQYKELEELYQKFKNDNFIIIGFPANNFGEQEPGTNQEIKEFCTKNYGVTFPMMEKISVLDKDMSEVYQYLTQKDKNNVMDSKVNWNFQKYLISEGGILEKVLDSKISPMDEQIVNWIKKKSATTKVTTK